MSFLTSGAFTTFVAATKAKSAEVNSNNAVIYNFLNTTTSEALFGNIRQSYGETTTAFSFGTSPLSVIGINGATSGVTVVTLPTAGSHPHRQITVKRTGSGDVQVSPQSGDNIDDVSAYLLETPGGSITLRSNGSLSWKITERYQRMSAQRIVSTTGAFAFSTGAFEVEQKIRTVAVNVNTSTGYTVTLPPVADNTHRILSVKHTGATTGTLTIDGSGSETIDGTTAVYLYRQYSKATLHSDGSTWHVIGGLTESFHYLPSSTITGNVSAVTVYTLTVMRIGNVVMVSGSVQPDPIAAGTIEFGLTLPIPSNFAGSHEASGVFCFPEASPYTVGLIRANTGNDYLEFNASAVTTAAQQCYFTAQYLIK